MIFLDIVDDRPFGILAAAFGDQDSDAVHLERFLINIRLIQSQAKAGAASAGADEDPKVLAGVLSE